MRTHAKDARVVGIGFWAFAAALFTLPTPAWVWVLLVFQGFVWPPLANLMARSEAPSAQCAGR
jgi:diguanylate cyclase